MPYTIPFLFIPQTPKSILHARSYNRNPKLINLSLSITNRLLYTGSMPRSVFMQIMHENHEFACAKINAIDFVCINCCWNEVRVNSNTNRASRHLAESPVHNNQHFRLFIYEFLNLLIYALCIQLVLLNQRSG